MIDSSAQRTLTPHRSKGRLVLIALSVTVAAVSLFLAAKPRLGSPGIKAEAGSLVAPRQVIPVSSIVEGTVLSVSASVGRHVRKGDVLVTLDPAPFQAAVAAAQKALDAAKAESHQEVASLGLKPKTPDASWVTDGPQGSPVSGAITAKVANLDKERKAEASAKLAALKADQDSQRAQAEVVEAQAKLESARKAVEPAKARAEEAESEASAAAAAIAGLAAAREKAQKEADRFKMLLDTGVVSRREAERVESKFTAAQAAEEAAKERASATEASAQQARADYAQAQKEVPAAELRCDKAKAELAAAQNRAKMAEQAAAEASKLLQEATVRVASLRSSAPSSLGSGEGTAPVSIAPTQVLSETADERLHKAEAILKEARERLSHLQIIAPVAGVVKTCAVSPGEKVGAGLPVIEIAPDAQP